MRKRKKERKTQRPTTTKSCLLARNNNIRTAHIKLIEINDRKDNIYINIHSVHSQLYFVFTVAVAVVIIITTQD